MGMFGQDVDEEEGEPEDEEDASTEGEEDLSSDPDQSQKPRGVKSSAE